MSPQEYAARRIQLGYTQPELAAHLGISRATIARREAREGKISREAEIAIRALHPAGRRRAVGVATWLTVDWTRSTAEIAELIGCTKCTVTTARNKYAPNTVRRQKTRIDWAAVDWSRRTRDIALATGASLSAVCNARRKSGKPNDQGDSQP